MHMFGICDGHGPNGREASNFVKYALHVQIEQRFPQEGQETFESIQKGLSESFKAVQQHFRGNVDFHEKSGSTACILLVQGHKVITANVGHSKAILVDKFRKVRELTTDHRPELPEERARIEKGGGRVVANSSQ